MTRILLVLTLVAPVWGTTRVVPTTADPFANGAQLQAAINASDCGDTIVLQAAAEYRTGAFIQSTIALPQIRSSACDAPDPRYITITSSAAGALTDGVRVSPASVPSMATISASSSGSVAITALSNAHHFRFIGILFTTTSNVNSSAGIVNYLVGDDKLSSLGTYPHHIWLDRCVFRPAEYAAGGNDPFRSAAQGVVIEGQEIRVTNSYLYEFQGVRTDVPLRTVTSVTNSTTPLLTSGAPHGHPVGDALNAYIYGASGAWTRINGWNNAVPTSATQFELRKLCDHIIDTANTARCQMFFNRPHNLQVGDQVTISGISYSGATSLNGSKTITAVPSPYEFEWASSGVPDGTYCFGGTSCQIQDSASSGYFVKWDSSQAGPIGNGVTWREAVPHNSFGVAMIGAPGPLRVINSYISAWFSGIFLGGGGSATRYSATLTNISPSGATFSSTSGLRIGEIVAVQTPYTAYLAGWRTVRVAGINGNSVTWSPWGITQLSSVNAGFSSGICSTNGTSVSINKYVGFQNYYSGVPVIINGVSYTVSFVTSNSSFVLTLPAGTQNNVPCSLAMTLASGALAQWRGVPGPNVEVRRNTFDFPTAGYPNSGVCKAAHEMKIVNGGVWDGNIYTGFPCVTLGLTQRNQTGATPWSSLRDLQFTNNLVLNAERTAQMLLDDDLATTVRKSQVPSDFEYGGGGLRFENNLFLDADTESHYAMALTGMDVSDIWAHNTFLRATVVGTLLDPTCDPSRTPPYGLLEGQFRDNVVKWGFYGFNTGSCWINENFLARNNVLIDSASVGSAAVNAAAPGNLYAGSVAAVGFEGTCDATANDWTRCGLATGSPFKGGGTDGLDPGADILQIQDHVRGWSEDAELSVTPGSTRAVAVFSALESGAEACSLQLYSDGARASLHADTSNTALQSCQRAGNVTDGNRVRFVLGTNTALTPATKYYFAIQDGSRTLVGSFSTLPTGTATTDVVQTGSAQALAYSLSPDLSAAVTLPAATVHKIPIPAGGVVYWKLGSGPIRVQVSP